MTIVITLGDLILLIFMTASALVSILYAFWIYSGEHRKKRRRKKTKTEIYFDDSLDDGK